MPMSDSVRFVSGISDPGSETTLSTVPGKEENMKKVIVVIALCLTASAASFGAEHLVSHSAKAAGKGTYKAAKYPVKETGKLMKFVF